MSSATQLAKPRKFDGKWGMECFNTRFYVPPLLDICGIQYEAKKDNLVFTKNIIELQYFF